MATYKIVEEWATVIKDGVEYPKWEISNLGRFRNAQSKRLLKTFVSGQYLGVNCYIKTENDKLKKEHFEIHRCVATRFCKNKKPGIYNIVNHIDGKKLNNVFTNLEWCDHAYNMKHAAEHNLMPCQQGSLNNSAKLTEDDIKDIKNSYIRYSKEFGTKALAKKYNVHLSTIHLIVSGKTWKHVE